MKDNSCEFRKIILFQAGEIVHVVTEEESGMCVVIIRNALKSFPISCLEKVSEDVVCYIVQLDFILPNNDYSWMIMRTWKSLLKVCQAT